MATKKSVQPKATEAAKTSKKGVKTVAKEKVLVKDRSKILEEEKEEVLKKLTAKQLELHNANVLLAKANAEIKLLEKEKDALRGELAEATKPWYKKIFK